MAVMKKIIVSRNKKPCVYYLIILPPHELSAQLSL